jgi:serine/threonine-protein kinase
VLDRMTDKDLERRYQDIPSLIADLEDALAIEAARSGTSTGEATAVLRTLPPRARRRLPLKMRFAVPVLVAIPLAILAVLAIGLIFNEAVDHTHRGTGAGRGAKPPAGTHTVSVGSTSAKAYDPIGGDGEHDADAHNVVDRDPGTSWATEHYTGGVLNKAGVGIYIDAKPSVDAKSIEIDSKPGWHAELYAAPPGAVPAAIDHGWQHVGGGDVKRSEQRMRLATDGKRYRYYLVWITKLPPDASQVEIAEIKLFAPKRG